MSPWDAGSFPWRARTLLGLRSSPENRPLLGAAAVGLFPHTWPHCQGREGLGSGPCGHPGKDLRSRRRPLRLVPMFSSETWFLLPPSAPHPQTLTSATQPRVITRGVAEGAGDEDWTGEPRAAGLWSDGELQGSPIHSKGCPFPEGAPRSV